MIELTAMCPIETPAPDSRPRTAHSAPEPGVFYAKFKLQAFLTDHTDRSTCHHLGMRFGVQEPDFLLTSHETLTFSIVVAESETRRLAVLNAPRIVLSPASAKDIIPVIKDRVFWFTLTPANIKRLLPHSPLRWGLVDEFDGITFLLLTGEIYEFDKYPGVSARKLALHVSPRVTGNSRGSTRDNRVCPGTLPIHQSRGQPQ